MSTPRLPEHFRRKRALKHMNATVANRIRMNYGHVTTESLAALMGMHPATLRKYARILGIQIEKRKYPLREYRKPPRREDAYVQRMVELAGRIA